MAAAGDTKVKLPWGYQELPMIPKGGYTPPKPQNPIIFSTTTPAQRKRKKSK